MGEIIANETTDKGLISKLCKQLIQLNTRKTTQSKSGQKTKTNIFPKKTYRWLINTWKDAQHHSLSEKCKSKLQWGITSHWSEWPSSKCLETINAREGVEKRECPCTVDGNVNWYSHYGEQCVESLKNGIKLPYDAGIPLLGIYPEKTRTEKDACNPMFITALFTIPRTCKQPRCPSTDEWIKMLWYIHTMEYYSAIKKNTFEFVLMRRMKLEPIIQSEVSQKEKHFLLQIKWTGFEPTQPHPCFLGSAGGTSGKEPACQGRRYQRCWFDSWVGKISWRRARATHSSILAWRIPRTEEPGGLQSIGPHWVRHDWSNLACTHVHFPEKKSWIKKSWFLIQEI